MENLKWQYEGDILIFDDIILNNPTISIQQLYFNVVDNQWSIDLIFSSPSQLHQRRFEMENVSGFDDLSETEVIAMIESEFPDFTQI